MRLLKEERAQSPVELLLILGGITLTAAIIGLYLKSIATTGQQEAKEELERTVTGFESTP